MTGTPQQGNLVLKLCGNILTQSAAECGCSWHDGKILITDFFLKNENNMSMFGCTDAPVALLQYFKRAAQQVFAVLNPIGVAKSV